MPNPLEGCSCADCTELRNGFPPSPSSLFYNAPTDEARNIQPGSIFGTYNQSQLWQGASDAYEQMLYSNPVQNIGIFDRAVPDPSKFALIHPFEVGDIVTPTNGNKDEYEIEQLDKETFKFVGKNNRLPITWFKLKTKAKRTHLPDFL